MQQNTKKNTTYWTDKHDEFCLENSLTPCAKLLWQWILRQKDDEPDLKEFNGWVKNHRSKPYCRLTVKTAFNQLVECRVIKLVKQFTWHLVRIVTRAIDDLFPKKKLRRENEIYDLSTSNHSESEGELYSSSMSSHTVEDRVEILEACANAGIYYDPEQDTILYQYSKQDIELALNYYNCLPIATKQEIYNPPGWFLRCLERRNWERLDSFSFSNLINLFKEKRTTTRR